MGFDYIDHPNYIRLPFSYIFHRKNYSTTFERAEKICNPNKKYFACFLVRKDLNEFSDEKLKTRPGVIARAKLFDSLSEYKFVASGGHFKNNIDGPGPRVRELNEEGIKQWRDDNINWISNCKFMIAYENKYTSGYMTEKVY